MSSGDNALSEGEELSSRKVSLTLGGPTVSGEKLSESMSESEGPTTTTVREQLHQKPPLKRGTSAPNLGVEGQHSVRSEVGTRSQEETPQLNKPKVGRL